MDIEETFETANLLIGDLAERFERSDNNRLDVYLKSYGDLVTAVAGLRVKRLGYLAAITGLDPGVDERDLEVLYHFCTGEAIINLRLRLPKSKPRVHSLTEIIPSAEPYERELREMFGVEIERLRNPDHLYLPDDWEEGNYPLRKDFIQTERLPIAEETHDHTD